VSERGGLSCELPDDMVDRGEDDREDVRCDAVGIVSKHDRRISKPVAVRSASTRPCSSSLCALSASYVILASLIEGCSRAD
jgi:hypothetical protein